MQQRFILIIIIVLLSLVGRPPASEAATITVNGTTCTLVNAIIAANSNSATGGCTAGGPGMATDTIVLNADTSLTTEYVSSTIFNGNQAGLPDITSNITIQAGSQETISGNSSDFRILNVVGGNLTLNGVTVSGGEVGASGGGIFVNNTGTLSLINSTITGNTVSSGTDGVGGGITNFGTIAQIASSTISNNVVQPTINASEGHDAYGGGIYNVGTITSIGSNSVFSSNRADGGDSSGTNGGVGLGGGIYTTTAINLNGVTFNANHVTGGAAPQIGGEADGGGFYGDLSGTSTNLTVTNNTATGGDGSFLSGFAYGGGIWIDAVNTLSLSTFSGNVATGGSGSEATGGALFANLLTGSPVSIDSLLIENNTAAGGAGGGSAGGFATSGGAFFNTAIPVTITDSTIRLNTADGGSGTPNGQGNGGGLFVVGSGLVTVDSSTINGNTADGGNGGGVWADGPTAIVNSTISGNSGVNGGGFFFTNSLNSQTIDFSTILNNTASNDGEAIYLSGTNLTIEGSVIASSGAVGDCFGVGSIAPALTNVKLAADASCANVAPKNIQINVHIEGTLQNNGGTTDTHAIIGGPDNNAINNVVSCGLSVDQRGQPRDTVCDSGSYEIPTTPMIVDSVECVHPNLEVTISDGDGPFRIDASGGVSVPVDVGTGTTVVLGPEKWDNLSVQETDGDGEAINFGQFKCRPLEIPDPLTPAHQAHTTNTFPTFSWTAIPNAARYRVFVFDDKVVANRTVDIRENSPPGTPAPTSYVLSQPLPVKRLFWRVRGRVNSVWGYWSVRFTLFIDPLPFAVNDESGPVINSPDVPVPTDAPVIQPPNDRGAPPIVVTPPPPAEETPVVQPPNSR